MFRQAFTVLLAVLLFWPALATQEWPLQAGHDRAELAAPEPERGKPARGSVDSHHLGDQPGQASAEAATDLPGWFPAPASMLFLQSGQAARPITLAVAVLAVPWDAPRRPPRS